VISPSHPSTDLAGDQSLPAASAMRNQTQDLLHLPDDVRAYLAALQNALLSALGTDQVLQIFLIGSASYQGGYTHGQSDLDVTVVTRSRLDEPAVCRVPRFCSHTVLPCPAQKLELVVYAFEAVHLERTALPYDILLNYNTGRAQPRDHVRYGNNPDDSPHWFILDIAASHANNLPLLLGPAFSEIFTPPPSRQQVLEALQVSLQWHIEHEATSSNAVLNACRGWRWASQGVFGSKLEGAQYAVPRLGGGGLRAVQTAVRLRTGARSEEQIEPRSAEALYALIASELKHALQADAVPLNNPRT
jgi:hypothetical protein